MFYVIYTAFTIAIKCVVFLIGMELIFQGVERVYNTLSNFHLTDFTDWVFYKQRSFACNEELVMNYHLTDGTVKQQYTTLLESKDLKVPDNCYAVEIRYTIDDNVYSFFTRNKKPFTVFPKFTKEELKMTRKPPGILYAEVKTKTGEHIETYNVLLELAGPKGNHFPCKFSLKNLQLCMGLKQEIETLYVFTGDDEFYFSKENNIGELRKLFI